MNAATAPDLPRHPGLSSDVALALPRACTLAPLGKLPEGLDAWSDGMRGRLLRWRTSSKPLAVQAQLVLAACQALDTASDAQLQQQLTDARAWIYWVGRFDSPTRILSEDVAANFHTACWREVVRTSQEMRDVECVS